MTRIPARTTNRRPKRWPSGDLTTLAAVKDWLGLAVSGDDMKLARLISAVSAFIQSWINRQLVSASYTETRDGTGTRRLALANYPVTAVASVTLDGVTLPSYQYVWTSTASSSRAGFSAAARITWSSPTPPGYSTVPMDIQQACIDLVALRYQRAAAVTSRARRRQNETVIYAGDADMPASIAGVLQQYKRVVQP
jgi:hypothetical protein